MNFEEMLKRAEKAGACSVALAKLKSFDSFEDAVKNCKSAPAYLYWYAKYVLEGRWYEAEEYIMKNDYYTKEYKYHFNLEEC